MGSGFKRQVINTRERAVSTDINRLQAFAAFDQATIGALTHVASGSAASSSGGTVTTVTTSAAPSVGEVIQGLTVRPQLGGALTLVEPGAVWIVQPDVLPSPDDSPCKLVNDPGVSDGTTLQLPPNASGGALFGVVECKRVETVLETENRDIFDPSSGTFAPATVNKVIASRLTYRIRANAIATGFVPSLDWLPLAAFVQPNGVNAWDTIVMWDVRPLASDRQSHTGNLTNLDHIATGAADVNGSVGLGKQFAQLEGSNFAGYIEAVGTNGRKLGGTFAIDPLDTSIAFANLLPTGFTWPAGGTLVNLFLATPYGLPRWAQYTTVAVASGRGGRAPGRLRGVPVFSTTGTVGCYRNAAGTIAPPSSLNTAPAFASLDTCMVLSLVSGFGGAQPVNWCVDGTRFHQEPDEIGNASDVTPAGLGGDPTHVAVYSFVAGTHYPAIARAIYVQLTASYGAVVAGGGAQPMLPWEIHAMQGSTKRMGLCAQGTVGAVVGGAFSITAVARCPVDPLLRDSVNGQTTQVHFKHNGGFANYVVAAGGAGRVIGWEL